MKFSKYISFLLITVCIALSASSCALFESIPIGKNGEEESTYVFVYGPEDDPYISAEASVLMSDGYMVYGGDVFCKHQWNDWIMTRPSTMTAKGSELRYCSLCLARQNREFGEVHGVGKSAFIDVECIFQMPDYPNGCEVVSLATVLKFMGYDVTVDELIDDHLPKGVYSSNGDDPFYKYLGNPRDLGVGCYAPAICEAANSYLTSIGEEPSAVDVSNCDYLTYKSYINRNIPVIFWGTTYMDRDPEIFGTVNIDGEEIIWRNHSHCFVMIGYTDTTYIFCDPLRGIIEYPKEDVEESHSLVYEQACVIK